MGDYEVPLVDDENPLYCPSVSAVAFLQTIRRRLHDDDSATFDHTPDLSSGSDEYLLPSFVRQLDKSVTEEDLLELMYNPADLQDSNDDNDTGVDSVLQSRALRLEPAIKQEDSPGLVPTFSDFQGSIKRERSLPSVNEGSFELSAKADRILYFVRDSSVSAYSVRSRRLRGVHPFRPHPSSTRALVTKVEELQTKMTSIQDELIGIAVGTETPRGMRALVSRLDAMFPGVRLKDKLASATCHQDIVDIMCQNGCLSSRLLNVLRTSEIEFLDLTRSMSDEGGLNLDVYDLLQVFAKPNSFLFLNEINLSGTRLRDSELVHLHRLPRLARLWLKDTAIGDEAIFLLLPLKRSLAELDIAYNPDITDDAVAVFCMLAKLRYLSFDGTSVSIVGIRRLARKLKECSRDMEIEIPAICEQYLRQAHRKYMLSPKAPLITDAGAAKHLSTPAIIRNLSAHAAVNREIPTQGPKTLLVKQLEEILETRQADIEVRQLAGLD